MNLNEYSFLAEFPYLIQLKTKFGVIIKGQICVKNHWITIAVWCPNYPDLRGITVTSSKNEWKPSTPAPDLNTCASILEVLRLYRNYLACCIDVAAVRTEDGAAVAALRRHLTVARHLRQLGRTCVQSAADDLSWVTLTTIDRCARRHELRLEIPDDYPDSRPRADADVPHQPAFAWHAGSTLLDIFRQWEELLAQYQSFWTLMDRIDAELWVLDPENPTRKDTKRRLVIDGRTSVEVTVDPQYPAAVPGCRFLGSKKTAASLRQQLAASIDDWDEYEDLVDNLERLLSVELIRRSGAACSGKEGATFAIDCGICYSYRLAGEAPARNCDDERCGQPFHLSCLYKWLVSLPGTHQTTRALFGECPYCKTPISCEIPSG